MSKLSKSMERDFDNAPHKNATIRYNVAFKAWSSASEIVREFIKRRNLILYGGMAIDYALRLRGKKLYEDGELPDYDFLSPRHIDDARDLLGQINKRLGPSGVEIYAHGARYPLTMRISVGNNNWVADISYCPRAFFDKMPTLKYDGVRLVHPHFQYADLHSSMIFPYENAPREVILARWEKDVKRFNMLFPEYPIKAEGSAAPVAYRSARYKRDIMMRAALTGFAAYSYYYNEARNQYADRIPSWLPAPKAPVVVSDAADSEIILDTPNGIIECYTHNPAVVRQKGVHHYAQILDLLEAASIFELDGATYIAYHIETRNVGERGLKVQQMRPRFVGIQALLKHFVAHYLLRSSFAVEPSGANIFGALNGPTANLYLIHYIACLELINIATERSTDPVFAPFTTPFGALNISTADKIMILRLIERTLQQDAPKLPVELPPSNVRMPQQGDDIVPFDYKGCPIYRIAGEEITISDANTVK